MPAATIWRIMMIRRCKESETEIIFSIINDAAGAYIGVIPI